VPADLTGVGWSLPGGAVMVGMATSSQRRQPTETPPSTWIVQRAGENPEPKDPRSPGSSPSAQASRSAVTNQQEQRDLSHAEQGKASSLTDETSRTRSLPKVQLQRCRASGNSRPHGSLS
jgi:hypothetical protein